MASVCNECFSFKAFGEKCWYYWQNKRKCSQFRATQLDEPRYKEADDEAQSTPQTDAKSI